MTEVWQWIAEHAFEIGGVIVAAVSAFLVAHRKYTALQLRVSALESSSAPKSRVELLEVKLQRLEEDVIVEIKDSLKEIRHDIKQLIARLPGRSDIE